eukprot:1160293-Pelagomonas_calceolata.AAC.5
MHTYPLSLPLRLFAAVPDRLMDPPLIIQRLPQVGANGRQGASLTSVQCHHVDVGQLLSIGRTRTSGIRPPLQRTAFTARPGCWWSTTSEPVPQVSAHSRDTPYALHTALTA